MSIDALVVQSLLDSDCFHDVVFLKNSGVRAGALLIDFCITKIEQEFYIAKYFYLFSTPFNVF